MKIADVTSALQAAQLSVNRKASAESAPAPAAAPARIDEAALRQQVEAVNETLERAEERLRFSVHKETNRIVIQLVDEATQEVVRELPSEKFLDLVADLMKLAGVRLDELR